MYSGEITIYFGWEQLVGSEACIFNVLRICARYNNLDLLEDGYGINIRNLIDFALTEYAEDDVKLFKTNLYDREFNQELLAKVQKAAAIIQFKLEGRIIKRNPEYNMDDRLLLDKINYKKETVKYNDGKTYKMLDNFFPTIDIEDPFKLSDKEEVLVEKIVRAFKNSEKLQKHIEFLYSKGSIYKVYNENLLIHGCIPIDENGDMIKKHINQKEVYGKSYLDEVDKIARKAYYSDNQSEKEKSMDFLWYLWCGKDSPIFCKDSMKTFERYFIQEKDTWKENKNPFYEYSNEESFCVEILKEFNIDEINGHIICGHMPVKLKSGESPIKANGKLLVIDGGLSKAYQETTGIAGYTLIYNSYGLVLAAHEPFNSMEESIINETDLYSSNLIVEKIERKKIKTTDIGKELITQIKDLYDLLDAYKSGLLK